MYLHDNVTRERPSVFQCDLKCATCGAPTASGQTCKRRVCMWLPFCHQHTVSIFGITTKASKAIPGATGLFATRPFSKHEMVAPYQGEWVTDAEVRRRYGSGELSLGPYLLDSVDAACERGIGSAANGAFGIVSSKAQNLVMQKTMQRREGAKRAGDRYGTFRLSRDNMGIKYWMVATRNIAAGEELLAHYGSKGYVAAFQKRAARCSDMGLACDRTVHKRSSSRSSRGASSRGASSRGASSRNARSNHRKKTAAVGGRKRGAPSSRRKLF